MTTPALTYDDVGATSAAVLHGAALPAGYRHLRLSVDLPGTDPAPYGQFLLTWALHRAAGVSMTSSADRAAVGVNVVTRLGGRVGVDAPCRVVWVVANADAVGFGYGTLPGHPFVGEEAFVVTRDAAGLHFVVAAFSRPATWCSRALGPFGPHFQRLYVRRLAHTLRTARKALL